MDYISKEDAIDCVLGQYCASSDETEKALGDAIEEIKKHPAADVVERKKGKWIPTCRGQIGFYCSVCGEKEERYQRNFCSNCGADMREE